MGSRTRSRRGSRSRPSRAYPWLAELFTHPQRHPVFRVVGWVIRVRVELMVLTVTVTVHLVLTDLTGWPGWTVSGAEVAVLTLVMVLPASRRYLVRRGWAVLSRHRVRACFAQTHTMTYDGRMPWLVWSRPSPVGERVRVWLPAGLCVNDLDHITNELAAACWARGARVHASRAQAATAVIEIVRRDPLAGDHLLRPDVAAAIASDHGVDTAVVRPLPDRALIPAPTAPAEHPTVTGAKRTGTGAPRTRTGTGARTTTHPTESTESETPTVVGYGGMDVTDYV